MAELETLVQVPDAEGEEEEETAELQLERMGLTPDWIIQVRLCTAGAGLGHASWHDLSMKAAAVQSGR